jgi:hypothetical protein
MSRGLYRTGTVALLALAAACSAAVPSGGSAGSTSQAVSGTCATPVIIDQSLFVALENTEGATNPLGVAALANFSFKLVMDQIIQTGAQNSGQTALQLYQQMLNTLNKPPCTGTINGFPVDCPRDEGILANTNPFTGKGSTPGGKLVPVALVNRFDLAPGNGANCGEYRVVFGMQDDPPPVARFLFIFEATLPNPVPTQGLAACLPVAQFWDNLSAPEITQDEFVSQLQTFYFDGIPGLPGNPAFSPVITAQNYGIGAPANTNTGQIRANFLSNDWQLREWTLSQSCSGSPEACTLTANNTMTKNNPFGELFADGATGLGATFQTEFIKQVKSLASTTIPLISMKTPDVDNAGQSSEQDSTNDYACQAGEGHANGDFVCGSNTPNTSLVAAIQTKLTALGNITLTPQDILQRATTQSCAGCHQLSPETNLGGGLTWPPSEGFTQVNEEGAQSVALTGTFLPFRSTVLTKFIDKHCGGADAGPDSGADEGDGSVTVGGQVTGSAN